VPFPKRDSHFQRSGLPRRSIWFEPIFSLGIPLPVRYDIGETSSKNMASLPSSIPAPLTPPPEQRRPAPPLEQGDRLTHAEFLKRYSMMPAKVKAERIEGIVHMPAAAVSANFHGRPHIDFAAWLGVYRSMTPGVAAADNSTLFLDTDNDPQPDACLYILPSHGGRTKATEEGYIQGSPELIVEIAASTMSYDLGAKLNAYRRNGVQEYIVHRTYDGEIDWFVLRDGQYEKLAADAAGIHRSEVFPGLWLAMAAMIGGNLAQVLSVLQKGTASEEHGKFVQALSRSARE
jgi:Uma2 family endonuclease